MPGTVPVVTTSLAVKKCSPSALPVWFSLNISQQSVPLLLGYGQGVLGR
jgi:hypothetical protein